MQSDSNESSFLEALYAESGSYDVKITDEIATRLTGYYKLVNEWNPRLHLVAPCSPREFATRHILESLYLLRHLPSESTVIDVGSGGGLPIVPCLLARPDLRATLIESSRRKSVFLREVLKQTQIEGSGVLAERFERVSGLTAEFVTCRALERFEEKLQELIEWSPPGSTLMLFGSESIKRRLGGLDVEFDQELLPNSDRRFLFEVKRKSGGLRR
jgi:16S rRNA (guanine527-N7)-methyltransferase